MSTEAFPVDPQAYEDLIEDLLMARHFAEDERLLRMDGFLAKLAERRRRAATNLEETGRSGDPAAIRRVAELAERLRTRICDRAAITSDDPDLIASRLENGRSLVIFLGDRVDPEITNQALLRTDEGLLPARLGRNEIRSRDQPARFLLRGSDHPMLEDIAGNTDLFSPPPVYGFNRVTPIDSPTVRVLAAEGCYDGAKAFRTQCSCKTQTTAQCCPRVA